MLRFLFSSTAALALVCLTIRVDAEDESATARSTLESTEIVETEQKSEALPTTPCDNDAERLCGDVPEGGGKRTKCLIDNRDKVSAECREFRGKINKVIDRSTGVKSACRDDAARFCADVPRGIDELKKCLTAQKKISEECKQTFDDSESAQ